MAAEKPVVRIRFICRNLPGKIWRECGSVHVGMGRGDSLEQIVSADAVEIVFEASYRIGTRKDGGPSFLGELAFGPANKRFAYITWLSKERWRKFRMFAAIKISLFDIPGKVVDRAVKSGEPLVVIVNMTQADGHVSCATLKPPDVEWQY